MAQAQYHHPHPPYGYRYRMVQVEDADEQRVLAIVGAMRGEGRTYDEIAQALNAAGFRNRRQCPFTTGSIPNLLKHCRSKKRKEHV